MTVTSSLATAPRVSVLLPVHNGEDYIESALRSVMGQTLRDIEIVAVDDASSDATPGILARLATEDARIRVLRPEQNLRLPRALNFGLEHVRGDYVARMDADDLCEPTRLQVQADFLDANPEIVLVGCSARHIDAYNRFIKASIRAQTSFHTRWLLRVGMAFRHPTFFFRREGWTWRYDPECTLSEDYDILARVTDTAQVACLPDLLFSYREHEGSLTGRKWHNMQVEARRIAERVQKADLPADIYDALEPYRDAYYDQMALDSAGVAAVFEGLSRMLAHDVEKYPQHGQWIRRQTAQLAAHALMRSGMSPAQNIATFLRKGPHFLPALGLRYMEAKRILPEALRSDRIATA
mgnify:CR=1 FL=1